jgi:hypothetical protein
LVPGSADVDAERQALVRAQRHLRYGAWNVGTAGGFLVDVALAQLRGRGADPQVEARDAQGLAGNHRLERNRCGDVFAQVTELGLIEQLQRVDVGGVCAGGRANEGGGCQEASVHECSR